MVREYGLPVLYVFDGVVEVLLHKRQSSSQHLVCSDTNRPDIDGLAVFTSEHFGRLVVNSASHGPHLHFSVSSVHLRDFEVDELNFPFSGVVQDILWFDVSMANALIVHVGDCQQELPYNITDFLLFKPPVVVYVVLELGMGVKLQYQLSLVPFLVNKQISGLDNIRVAQDLQNLELHFERICEFQVGPTKEFNCEIEGSRFFCAFLDI